MTRTILSFFSIGFVTFALLSQTASSQAKPEIKNYGLIDPPICKTQTGEIIKHYPGTSEQIVQFGGFLAAAGDFEVGKNGGIVNEDRIYYDETNMPYLPPLLQSFLFHHECAHITLSHLEIPPVERQSLYWKTEQSADCAAFKEIKNESTDFENDANIILTNFAFIANEIMKSSPGNEESRAKFISKRVENMQSCPAFKN